MNIEQGSTRGRYLASLLLETNVKKLHKNITSWFEVIG